MSSDHGRTAAAFLDLDKTIIAKSSTLAFGRVFYRGGLINRRSVVRAGWAQFVFRLVGISEKQMDTMRDHLADLCRGWDVRQVRALVDGALPDIVEPLIFSQAVEVIGLHKAAGLEVVVVSSSGREVVEPIAAMVGADLAISTRMVEAGGVYTGQIAYYAFGETKAEAVRALADERGYALADCFAYSDSITDVPMLSAVGHPFAVNPDRRLRHVARERGWPVLTFTRHTSVVDSRSPALYTGIGLVAAAVGATAAGLLGARRRHTLAFADQ